MDVITADEKCILYKKNMIARDNHRESVVCLRNQQTLSAPSPTVTHFSNLKVLIEKTEQINKKTQRFYRFRSSKTGP